MRQAKIYNNGRFAGILEETSPQSYEFRYDDLYYSDPSLPAISLTLPKNRQIHRSRHLFSFFANMLSEGHNRAIQARLHKLDPADDFGFLLSTAGTDTPGSVTIIPVEK